MIASFRHPDGIRESTRLTTNVAAAATILSVQNSEGLSADDYIVVGSVGSDRTEIVKITTVDSVTQLTTAAVSFTHDRNDLVSFTPYNQMQLYSATTASGAKTQVGTAVDLEVEDLVTKVNLSTVTSGFVFSRYYNSTTAGYSSYSPAVPVVGFAENSLRHIIDMARLRTQETTENLLSDVDLLNVAKECSDQIETVRKNWSFVQASDTITLTAGVQTYDKPSTLAGPESIASVCLGYDGNALDYVDLKEFRYKSESVPKTVTTAAITSASTTIAVKDSTAFGGSGTLAIGGDKAVLYTTTTNQTFAGVSGIVRNHASGSEVFLKSDTDQPEKYSFWAEKLLLYPPVDGFYLMNIDFYKTIPRMTDVSIETVVPMPSLFCSFLMSEIYRMRGKVSRANFYFKKFEKGLDLLSRKNRNKQIVKFRPALAYIKSSTDQDSAIACERIKGGA